MKCAIIAIEGLDVIEGRSDQVYLQQGTAAPGALNTFPPMLQKKAMHDSGSCLESKN